MFTSKKNNVDWYLDHVVIVVKNLADAVQDFTRLGFTVILGGEHAGGFDHNALILLSDGSYIELYSPVQPSIMNQLQGLKKQDRLASITVNLDAIKSRFIDHIAAGEGLADFAISASHLNLHQEIIALHKQGLSLAGPICMDRICPDEKKVVWDVAVPKTNSLPFLITDVTPRSLRAGKHRSFLQDNGVTGVASITILVPNLKKTIQQYQILLNTKPITKSNLSIPGAKVAAFKIGTVNIILAQPIDKSTRLYQNFITRGPGCYNLSLYTSKKIRACT